MGNDGGSIPTRRELVREAAKSPSTAQVKEAQREVQSHFWTTCPLSHKPLIRPIVSDCVGNLYNKDAILKFLLPGEETEGISSKADCEEILCGRVKGLRDVVELNFEVDTEKGEHVVGVDEKKEGWICPVTAKSLGPNAKSVYLVPCGHVFAEEAIRQLKGDKCLQCNESYIEGNVIPILPPSDTDKQRLAARGQKLAEQGLSHSLKKAPGSKKRKKQATATSNGDSNEPEPVVGKASTANQLGHGKNGASSSTPTPAQAPNGNTPGGIKNAATAMLTAKVLDEENERKRRKKMLGTNENLDSLYSKESAKDRKSKSSGDFMTRGFTIPAAGKK